MNMYFLKSIQVYIICGICIVSSYCGDFTEEHVVHHQNQHLPPIVFSEDIDNQHLSSHEYLVAFKTHSHTSEHSFLAFHSQDILSRIWSVGEELYRQYVESGKMQYIHMISHISPYDFPQHTPQTVTPSLGRIPSWMDIFENQTRISQSAVNIGVVRFASNREAHLVLNDLLNQDKIWFAEPNTHSFISQTNDTQSIQNFKNITKSYQDTAANNQSYYHIQNTQIDKALDKIANFSTSKLLTVIKSAPVIAVIDSGIDITHPALEKRVVDLGKEAAFRTSRACMINSTTASTKGCNTAIDYKGQTLKKGILGDGEFAPHPSDNKQGTYSHGTHVAGLATGYLPDKVYGGCPICWLMPIRAAGHINSHKPGSISNAATVRALQFVSLFQKNGTPIMRVVNASFGQFTYSRSVDIMIKKLAHQGKGTLVVAAAGNEDASERSYPASYHYVLSVSAIDKNLQKTFFSNSGYQVDVSAPGDNITSSIPNNDISQSSGTSQASPIVAGIAGLLFAVKPNATSEQVKKAIIYSAAESNAPLYKKNPKYIRSNVDGKLVFHLGHGQVNAQKALERMQERNFNPPVYLEGKRVELGCSLGDILQSSRSSHLFYPKKDNPYLPWGITLWILLLPFISLTFFAILPAKFSIKAFLKKNFIIKRDLFR